MNKLIIGNDVLTYQTTESKKYCVKLSDEFYVKESVLDCFIIGEVDMFVYDFYYSDNQELEEKDYVLSESFQRIITRFPHTNMEKISYEKDTYVIKHVGVVVSVKDYVIAQSEQQTYHTFLSQFEKINQVKLVSQKEKKPLEKLKRLMLDGTFGKREYITNQHHQAQSIQHKLTYGDEFYGFGSYSYAGFIEFLPEYHVTTYDDFHEQYGKYIYSMVIKRHNIVVPLLWPDYLYHRPENHLEFGVLSDENIKRYDLFNDWEEGDNIQIDILAEGFEDVSFTSTLKKPLKQKPKRTKESYLLGEDIEIELPKDILDEIKEDRTIVDVIPPNQEDAMKEMSSLVLNQSSMSILTKETFKTGHYQIRIHSHQYGQLLIVATLKKKKE